MSDLTLDQQKALALAGARARMGQSDQPKSQAYTGSVLPFSADEHGNTHFDSNAGILGMIKRSVMAPGDALQGKFDPLGPEGQARAAEFASTFSPASRATALAPAAIPTRADLATATNAGYTQMRNSGVGLTADAMRQFADQLKQRLWSQSHSDATDPKTFALIDEITKGPPGSSVGIDFLDKYRQKLGDIAGGQDERRAATAAINGLDDFLDNGLSPSHVVVDRPPATTGNTLPVPTGQGNGPGRNQGNYSNAGNLQAAQDAIDALRTARANAAAGFRSDAVTGLEQAADRRANAANSGRNTGNTIRQRLATLLNQYDQGRGNIRGFSPAEADAADQIVAGSPSTNSARYVGNLLGGGGGLGQTMLTAAGAVPGGMYGGLSGALMGAVPGAVGAAATTTANQLTRSQLRALDTLIRQRSPLAAQNAANPAVIASPSSNSAALARLLAVGPQQQDQSQ